MECCHGFIYIIRYKIMFVIWLHLQWLNRNAQWDSGAGPELVFGRQNLKSREVHGGGRNFHRSYVSDVLSFTVTPLRPPFPLPLPYPEITLGRRKC